MTKKQFIKNLVVLNVVITALALFVVLGAWQFVLNMNLFAALSPERQASTLGEFVSEIFYQQDNQPKYLFAQVDTQIVVYQIMPDTNIVEVTRTQIANIGLPVQSQVTIVNNKVHTISSQPTGDQIFNYANGLERLIYLSTYPVNSIGTNDGKLIIMQKVPDVDFATNYRLIEIGEYGVERVLVEGVNETEIYIYNTSNGILLARNDLSQCYRVDAALGEYVESSCVVLDAKSNYRIERSGLNREDSDLPDSYPQNNFLEQLFYIKEDQKETIYTSKVGQKLTLIGEYTDLSKNISLVLLLGTNDEEKLNEVILVDTVSLKWRSTPFVAGVDVQALSASKFLQYSYYKVLGESTFPSLFIYDANVEQMSEKNIPACGIGVKLCNIWTE